ncbi:unnamed protein product [Somion occarium]|uniref:Uncharacterized protein n=1 Tax=Somion occarium TaxID=3059160 RepID=A0ABP1DKC4_9APHY
MSAIDTLSNEFQEKLRRRPENRSLRETLQHLTHLRTGQDETITTTLESLKDDFEKLEAEGLWQKSPETERLLQDLVYEVARLHPAQKRMPAEVSSNNPSAEAAGSAEQPTPIPVPPPLSTPLLPLSSFNTTVLPLELIEALNQTYFLHLLATEPEKILPPGKSLLSVMIHPNAQTQEDPMASLKNRVEDLVHKAFWDEAFESLSNPTPAVEMPRLKRLYEDLHTALVTLLPSDHPVLVTLASPLSPTSAPLRSAVSHLREVLDALKQRCAPARDAYIDALIVKLDDPLPSSLPQLVVETVRDILKLAEGMKEDLSQFVLGTMGEKQLREVISAQAKTRERELVHSLWDPESVRTLWKEWLIELDPAALSIAQPPPDEKRWVVRLMQALGTPHAISCNIPTRSGEIQPSGEIRPLSETSTDLPLSSSNTLPPPLFFVTPTLLQIQNFLQALVIAASLRSLIRLPPAAAQTDGDPSKNESPEHTFTQRVWILLKSEIEGEPDADGTKLVHLADEIIRTRRSFGGPVNEEEENRLRTAVDRTLRTSDPVFTLLSKRLVNALTERLLVAPEPQGAGAVPFRLQAGKDTHKKPHMWLSPATHQDETEVLREKRTERSLLVKGFEDGVLVDAATDVLVKLRGCVEWTEDVWGDVIKGD